MLLFASAATAAPQPLETYRLPPARYAQAVEYQRRLTVLHFAGAAWNLAVLGAMAMFRTGPGFRKRIAPTISSPAVARAVTAAVLLAIVWIAGLPLAVYRHSLSLGYGLSIERWGEWSADWGKSAAITWALAVILSLAFVTIARRWPHSWWIRCWALSVLVSTGGAYLAPYVFDPLFFHFRPLSQQNPALARALQDVAARAGYQVPAGRILEVDASSKTRAVNAYMTGFGDSRRIVIWDTTLAALTVPQIQTVFAHELGHDALHHIALGVALGGLGLLAAFFVAGRILGGGLADVANLPLALGFALVIALVSEPLVNSVSRWVEHQADIYELEAMHGLVPDAGRNSAQVDQVMAEIELDDPAPGPFAVFWLYDHPPAGERMLFAQEYDAWHPGRSPRYVGR